MVGVAHAERISSSEYLAMERRATDKHVLWDGQVFAMAGASRRHNQLVAAVLRELGVALLGRPCRAYASDQRIYVPLRKGYVYPDASVTCPPMQTAPEDTETISNPRLIVEVLSESTEAFDRGDKFRGYASIPSLQDYLLLSQDAARVDLFSRRPEGWLLRSYVAGDSLELASIEATLSVDALYAGLFDDTGGPDAQAVVGG
ncbi:MAG: Uma2 family endonuclease [Polyangiaceae bacterium]|nr:Uma2 family endonuclease [Polyangiaceae bacterium]